MGLNDRIREFSKMPEHEVIKRMINIENCMRHNLGSVRKRLIAIEGTIGTGKSTIADMLEARVGIKAFLEDVDNNETWGAIIEQFYKDRIKFGFSTQIALLHARRGQATNAFYYPRSSSIDRTYWGDRFVFVPTLIDGGLPKDDVKKLDEEYEKFRSEFPRIDLLLILKANPQTAYDRLILRDRAMEAATDLAKEKIGKDHYLVKIAKRYDALPEVLNEKGLYSGPVITIDEDNFK